MNPELRAHDTVAARHFGLHHLREGRGMIPYAWLRTALIGAISIGTVSAAQAGCGATGRYQGTITSMQAGTVDTTLNLRCSSDRYSGILVTSVGKFPIKSGSYADGRMRLVFDGGGTDGSLDLLLHDERAEGSFTLQQDHGPVSLARMGDASPTDSFDPTFALTPAQWREDLAYFARELPRRHASAFHRITRREFAAAVARLDSKIGTLDADQTYVELDGLATMIGDGHTFVIFPPDNANLPLDVARFDGKYRVISATQDYAHALGASLVAIDGVPVGEARKRLLAITPGDETQSLREGRVESFLTIGMMLHGTRISRSRDQVSFTLQDDTGKTFTLDIKSLPPGAKPEWKHVYPEAPLYLQHAGEGFWCTMPAPKVAYCSFRGYKDLSSRAQAMLALLETKPDKLVIDMRGNYGGDFNDGLKYVIGPIARDAHINRKGRLFVLMNEGIFSAGMSNTAQFRTHTHAILVGEPIGERPNTYQEAREMMLPNSHLVVRYSTKFYQFVDRGPNVVAPDKLIVTKWAQYKNGEDPVLAWTLEQ